MANKILIGVFAAFALWVVSQQVQGHKEVRAEEKKLACSLDKNCANKRVDELARLESLDASRPVRSSSGASFFRGDRCESDCSGHQAGYDWARRNNIMLTSHCPNETSASFTLGCMNFATEFGKDDIEDDADGCIPTKYTDC